MTRPTIDGFDGGFLGLKVSIDFLNFDLGRVWGVLGFADFAPSMTNLYNI